MTNKYESNFSFGTLTSVEVESFGEPGSRTFCLSLTAGSASALLWLEKDHLEHLSEYVFEISRTLSKDDQNEPVSMLEAPWNGDAKNYDFKVGQLALGHDASSKSFLFLVHKQHAADHAPADISFWIPLIMAERLSREAMEICNAGRAKCFLCNQPINPEGHMCVRSNGHMSL
jgi:uncharacterized repeat protein (TIGR03847 family)